MESIMGRESSMADARGKGIRRKSIHENKCQYGIKDVTGDTMKAASRSKTGGVLQADHKKIV